MNKALAEFLVAKGRPKKTKNYPELNGFLYAIACSPEVISADLWLPMIFDNQEVKYKDVKEQENISQSLLNELSMIEGKIANNAPALADYFRPSEELMENFDEDSPVAHWGRGFLSGHDWLEALWSAYFPEEQKSELIACINLLSFFADKVKAAELCNAQQIDGLKLDVYAESVIANFNAAAEGYAHYGLGIRAALDAYHAQQK